jgi:hypothetical protein
MGFGGPNIGSAVTGTIGSVLGLSEFFKSGPKRIVRPKLAIPIAEDFAGFLTERLGTSPEDTESFARMSAAIREAISGQAGAARQRLSDASVAGGFFDSGERISALQDIDRAELQTFGEQLRLLLESLEERRVAGVLPFLGLASGENVNITQLNQARRQFGIDAQFKAAEAFKGT